MTPDPLIVAAAAWLVSMLVTLLAVDQVIGRTR